MKLFENNKILFRYLFVAIALLIVVASLIVSHFLVENLSKEERNKIEIWAEATKEMASNAENMNMNLVAQILKSNTTIPVILYDKKENFYTSANIDLPELDDQIFLKQRAESFKKRHEPIIIEAEGFDQYIYYDDSYTLKQLQLYPYVQLGVLFIFMITAFFSVYYHEDGARSLVGGLIERDGASVGYTYIVFAGMAGISETQRNGSVYCKRYGERCRPTANDYGSVF